MESDDTNNQAPTARESGHKLLLVGVILLAVLLLLGVLVWSGVFKNLIDSPNALPEQPGDANEADMERLVDLYNSQTGPLGGDGEGDQNIGLDSSVGNTEPTGVVLFTSRIPQESTPYIQIHAVDLDTEEAIPEVLIPDYYTSSMATFEDVQNPTDFFLSTVSERSARREPDEYGVHHYQAESGFVRSYAAAIGNGERNFEYASLPGLLALNRQSDTFGSYVDSVDLRNWEVVVIDTNSDEEVTVLKSAWSPQWLGAGTHLMYLRTDGLYVYDMETRTESALNVISGNGEVNALSAIDVSPTGEHLVWTTAKRGLITVFDLDVTTGGEGVIVDISLNLAGQISDTENEYYAPVFSPDGQHYLVQAIDALSGNQVIRQNARLEIRPVASRAVVRTIDISDFWFDAFFTDEWLATMPVFVE